MSARQIKIQLTVPATIAGLLLLSACSTVQENPNYKFSSKYQTSETLVMADATSPETTTDALTPTSRTLTPQTETAPVVSASNAVQPPSPTEEAYNADAMIGTPGYAILMAEEAEAARIPVPAAPSAPAQPTPQPLMSGPREVTYDYAQNVILGDNPAPAAIPAAPAPQIVAPSRTQATAPTARTYTVQPGDTIYSLSRRLCTPIGEIMTANGIGSDFGIKIGQSLTLPNSRC
ncbi:MAG: LysM domain-containing protein [Pseudomonadota bacterium]